MASTIKKLGIEGGGRRGHASFTNPQAAKQYLAEIKASGSTDPIKFFGGDIGDTPSLEELTEFGIGAEAQFFGAKPVLELEAAGQRVTNFGTTASGQVITREQAIQQSRSETAASTAALQTGTPA